jgi:hypothetical protein
MFRLLFQQKKYVFINSDQNVLGYILGDFFTNSSGHPDHGGLELMCTKSHYLIIVGSTRVSQ